MLIIRLTLCVIVESVSLKQKAAMEKAKFSMTCRSKLMF